MHFASESLFHGLRGSSGFQMTSEVKADLRIELSDLNYPRASMGMLLLPLVAILVASEAMAAFK